jgi:hypothetical protein
MRKTTNLVALPRACELVLFFGLLVPALPGLAGASAVPVEKRFYWAAAWLATLCALPARVTDVPEATRLGEDRCLPNPVSTASSTGRSLAM